jgi:hypothetical protein
MKTLIDTAILLACRIGFFLASRQFLLSLNPKLRSLSTQEPTLPQHIEDSDTDDELESAPKVERKGKAGAKETRGLNRAAR